MFPVWGNNNNKNWNQAYGTASDKAGLITRKQWKITYEHEYV